MLSIIIVCIAYIASLDSFFGIDLAWQFNIILSYSHRCSLIFLSFIQIFVLHLNLKVLKNKLPYGTNINLINVCRYCKWVTDRSRPSHDQTRHIRNLHNRPIMIA